MPLSQKKIEKLAAEIGKKDHLDILKRWSFNLTDIEIRDDDDAKKLTGHAAVFDSPADGYWFREKIAAGAFAESIKEDDIRALWNHDTNIVLGRNRADTLELREDKRGLAVEIIPPDTQLVNDLTESVRRGDVSQMSFGFEVLKQTWVEEEDEKDLRIIEKVKLWEVSPVTFPFYTDTDVSLRNYMSWCEFKAQMLHKNKFKRRRLRLRQIRSY